MASKPQPKKKTPVKAKSAAVSKPAAPSGSSAITKPAAKPAVSAKDVSRIAASLQQAEAQVRRQVVLTPEQERRREALHRMLMAKRQEVMKEIGGSLGQSVSVDQQRLEVAKDIGDQAMMDLEREVDISLMEMRNRKRQLIDEAMTRLADGTYGICAECGVEISEKRLAVVPFAKLCVECQARTELLERIEKEEDRD